MIDLELLGTKAKEAASSLIDVTDSSINSALNLSARLLRDNIDFLQRENKKDIDKAEELNRSASFIDRLVLSDKVIESMAEGLEQVALLTSPTGKTEYSYTNKEQGIFIEKKKVPFGVIGIIYEARPNVTADAFALSLKTKNAVILKGGSDAINSNIAIVNIIKRALSESGIDQNAISLIEDTSRETTVKFMQMNEYIDLLIPRGSASLIKTAIQNSTIPIIETGTGNCHVYVDEFADIDKAVKIIFNAKTQRYGVCNACESLVIHSKILEKALPSIAKKLSEKNVELRLDERALKVYPKGVLATEEDFGTEYLDAIISVKTVDSLQEAISHINKYSTRHSESIVTENKENADIFMQKIDASSVYHNASTRFTDGFVFGFGAEIGISTQKLHARGPMGLEALCTSKYYVKDINGDGAVRK